MATVEDGQRGFLGVSLPSHGAGEADDSASIVSYMPGTGALGEAESILGEVMGQEEKTETEKMLLRTLGHKLADSEAQSMFLPDPQFDAAFNCEFDEIEAIGESGSNEGLRYTVPVQIACADIVLEAVMQQWRAKLKHFLILSSAGKPIYSRHGDDQLITNYIGVVQTIISFYQSTNDVLKGFTAGDVRFVVMSKGPLNLVAITRLPESDSQLRTQLEALYMQILSTLTLPSMERMFAARANYDLRRPLQGTETLLSALADGFTRGSSSTLLSALECLKLRKSHRSTINNTLLKTRSENLLYGLIVASGKLVSVVRPKKHSLHPGDLHLIFNMLFEAGSVKAGGGENWIPLCLPGFNNTGYLYMYVSFLNLEHPTEPMQERPSTSEGAPDEVAILLISAEKESFFELRGMRDELVEVRALHWHFSLQHFLYKVSLPSVPVLVACSLELSNRAKNARGSSPGTMHEGDLSKGGKFARFGVNAYTLFNSASFFGGQLWLPDNAFFVSYIARGFRTRTVVFSDLTSRLRLSVPWLRVRPSDLSAGLEHFDFKIHEPDLRLLLCKHVRE